MFILLVSGVLCHIVYPLPTHSHTHVGLGTLALPRLASALGLLGQVCWNTFAA